MKDKIIPGKQNTISNLFSNTVYYIDYYQREYRWKNEDVKTLLDDIFYRFELNDLTKGDISNDYWYYLNTYMTNVKDDKTYLIDGQQRLTTLTLIIIALYHIAKSEGVKISFLEEIRNMIMGRLKMEKLQILDGNWMEEIKLLEIFFGMVIKKKEKSTKKTMKMSDEKLSDTTESSMRK